MNTEEYMNEILSRAEATRSREAVNEAESQAAKDQALSEARSYVARQHYDGTLLGQKTHA